MPVMIQLQQKDLENIRFAYSPLTELVMSYEVFNGKHQASHLNAWLDEARRAMHGVDMPYMDALMSQKYYIADFVTPTPMASIRDIHDDFAHLYDTSDNVIRSNVQHISALHGESEIRNQFLAQPRETLDCLLGEMQLYWRLTLAHHWGRIQTVLENDILYQARQQALNGVDAMITDLSPDMHYNQAQIIIDKNYCGKPEELHIYLEGCGLQLVPNLFLNSRVSWQITDEFFPMLIYAARGAGLWYQADIPDPEAQLRAAFGDMRAKLLHTLQTPAHTGELAFKLGVTSGAISQQLNKLAEAGLVDASRSGYRVLYRLSLRGEKLVELFTA
jgi:DNA-binding transcriptional ArsR family regulator